MPQQLLDQRVDLGREVDKFQGLFSISASMKRRFSTGLVLGAGAMLSGCGAASDRFQPGTWELESWMEVDGRSEAISGQVDTVRITPEMADFGAKPVFFSSFYHGQGGVNVTFADGIISGNFDQQAVAPFPAHQQAVEGWYAPDAFEIRITMPQIGSVQTYQVVQGRLTEPE